MMKQKLVLAVAISAAALIGCKEQAADEDVNAAMPELKTSEQRVSYGTGLQLGERIKSSDFGLDLPSFFRGVTDAFEGNEALMSQEEIAEEMQSFQQLKMAEKQQEMEQLAGTNQAEGVTFLTENASKEGVLTTSSGLQYKVITAGTGKKPTATDTVEVNYAGKLLDGTEFDSSYKRGSTVTFPVNGVIPGWIEALQLMTEGSKWELYIPSDLAYGSGGTGGGPIGPNATLIFDVELVSIKASKE